jgi:hypothetical protein
MQERRTKPVCTVVARGNPACHSEQVVTIKMEEREHNIWARRDEFWSELLAALHHTDTHKKLVLLNTKWHTAIMKWGFCLRDVMMSKYTVVVVVGLGARQLR